MKIDWAYFRKGWASCKKAQEVLDKKNATPEKEINARKESINQDKAWELLSGCQQVSIAKGKKVVEYIPDLKIKDQILKDVMGRSGNLRAPAIIIADTCYIGFNQDMYESFINSAS